MIAALALSCLILGDSIALGVSQHLPECRVVWTRVGAPSTKIARKPLGTPLAHWAIVSAGANDCRSTRLPDALASILDRIRSSGSTPLFIVPSNCPRVASWAVENGVLTVAYVPGRDGVHPRSYRELSSKIRKLMLTTQEVESNE